MCNQPHPVWEAHAIELCGCEKGLLRRHPVQPAVRAHAHSLKSWLQARARACMDAGAPDPSAKECCALALANLASKQEVDSRCCFYNENLNVMVVVHGKDFTALCPHRALMHMTICLGPPPQHFGPTGPDTAICVREPIRPTYAYPTRTNVPLPQSYEHVLMCLREPGRTRTWTLRRTLRLAQPHECTNADRETGCCITEHTLSVRNRARHYARPAQARMHSHTTQRPQPVWHTLLTHSTRSHAHI